MRPVCLFRRSSSYWSIETSSRALVLAVREFGFVKLLHLLRNAKLWSSSVLLLIFASSSSSSSFDPRGSAPTSRRRTLRRRGGTSSSSMVPAGRSAVIVVVVFVVVTTARRPVLTTTRIVFLSLFFSTSASSFSSSSESMMVLILFSFFFSSSKSFSSSSSRALLRDLVVVLVVAAQFAVRIGNGFRRRILRIRLVRPHLSKLRYTCVYYLCYSLLPFLLCVLLSVRRSPFKESFECSVSRRRVSDETFPHFSISLREVDWIRRRERERETTTEEDVLVCPILSGAFDSSKSWINKRDSSV